MTSGQNPSAGKSRTFLLVALVAVLAVAAAVVTVLVSSATYSPGARTMSPKIQVAAGSDHIDTQAGLVVRVPEGWRAEPGELIVGTTALVPEPTAGADGAEGADGADGADGGATAEESLGGIVLVGALTPDFFAAREADNQRAAMALVTGMGGTFLPIPGRPTDHRMKEISSPAGDGWALSYRVAPDAAPGTGTGTGAPESGLVYTAVLGEGDERFWLTYIGSPADGGMDSPHAEWADEIVERLRLSEAHSVPVHPVDQPA